MVKKHLGTGWRRYILFIISLNKYNDSSINLKLKINWRKPFLEKNKKAILYRTMLHLIFITCANTQANSV